MRVWVVVEVMLNNELRECTSVWVEIYTCLSKVYTAF